jgi:hypothetical protein
MSDHCPVEFKTLIKHTTHAYAQNVRERIVWRNKNTSQLYNLVSHLLENKHKLDDTVNDIVNGSVSLNEGISNITGFLYDSSFQYFGETSSRSKNVKVAPLSQWFDDLCRVAKSEFMSARRRFKECHSDINRELFLAKRSIFAKRKRIAKAKFSNHEKREMKLLSATNPKQFWNKIRKYKTSANKTSTKASLHDFVTHFDNVSNSPHPHDAHIDIIDEDMFHGQVNDSLDQPITADEILKCIHSLKRNKALA